MLPPFKGETPKRLKKIRFRADSDYSRHPIGRRLPSDIRRVSFPSGKEGCKMVTHEELYLLLGFIVALLTLLLEVFKYFDKKKK